MIEMGESFYQNLIPQMVLELDNLKLLEDDEQLDNENLKNNEINIKNIYNLQAKKSKRKIIKTNINGKK